ncbi:ABC-2 family transporter [Kineothrix alysoides]|uniref:ABC-2 family transporter n=2 Tax=Kineothrix alysoides TaxID=1469948 RepID=A0A4R1R4R9_9FIRM|nr:ABC-2 family transporter [Kineothrix alysoides]
MRGFHTMLRINFRLLFRNAGYLCFLIILPMTAVALLNLNAATTTVYGDDAQKIVYLKNEDDRIEDMTSLRLNIKVYDLSGSKLSSDFLNSLQGIGCYQLYCYNSEESKMPEIKEKAIKVMNENTIGAVLVIPSDFDRLILDGDYEDSVFLYYGNEDARVDTLQNYINQFFRTASTFSTTADDDKEAFEELLAQANKEGFQIRTESVGSGTSVELTSEQLGYMSTVKYSWALVTMAFTFSGVFVSNIVIMERNNGVFKRTKLSGIGMASYGLVKFFLAMGTVIIQIFVMGAGIKLFVKTDFGINMGQYLLLTFGLALILNTLSVVIGILVNNLLNTSYIAFFLATFTFTLSGLFFTAMPADGWLANAALLTPQRWGIKAVETLLTEGSNAFGSYALAVIGFLALILCGGFLGLNLIQKEEL